MIRNYVLDLFIKIRKLDVKPNQIIIENSKIDGPMDSVGQFQRLVGNLIHFTIESFNFIGIDSELLDDIYQFQRRGKSIFSILKISLGNYTSYLTLE